MWFNKKDQHALFFDCRKECKPDIIGDYKHLEAFKDEQFYLIVFDPNFRREKDGYPSDRFELCYGKLLPETWQSDFRLAFKELWRVLKPYGVLVFKWNTHKIKLKEVLNCFPIKPKFGQRTTGSKGRKETKTYWFCFMKIPDNELK